MEDIAPTSATHPRNSSSSAPYNNHGKRYYQGVRGRRFSFRRFPRSHFRPVWRPISQPSPDTAISLSDADGCEHECTIGCAAYCGSESLQLVELPCKHQLHRDCLETLLCQRLGRCPVCRGNLDSLRRMRHHIKVATECEKEFVGDYRAARLNSLEHALGGAPESEQCPEAVARLVELTGLDTITVRKSLRVANGNCDEAATMLFDLLEWKHAMDDA